jgi:hypothetical protein
MNWDTIEEVLVILLFGSVGGAISGAFVANFFANKRDKCRRKLELLAFLNAWKSDFQANRPKYAPEANLFRKVVELFDDFRIELIAKSTGVELDYSGTTQESFKTLVDAITSMTPGSVGGDDGRQKLLKAIGELATFLRDN